VHVVGLARDSGREPGSLDYPVVGLGPDLPAQIEERTAGAPLAGFLDSVGGAVVPAVLPLLRQGATIVSYGVLDDSPVPVRNSDLIYRSLPWKGFAIDHWLAANTRIRDVMTAERWSLIRDGVLELPVRGGHPLAEIHRAVAAAVAPQQGAMVLVVP
jgi:NADPH:quinone reductase-like Zn-dependent oxidoreductase